MTKFTKIAAIAVFAFAFAFATSAAVTVPPNLMQGSSGTQVMNLQTALGIGADGAFGPITKSAVMSYQAGHGLTADGIVGPMTASSINGSAMVGSLPAGCTSSTGYSSTTGMSCSTVTTLPAGCTSTSGFSTTTGMSCSTVTTLPAGCTSTVGYSSTTGTKCDSTIAGTPSGPLTGVGQISSLNKLSEYNSEEVSAGQTDVKVIGFDVKATTDGDIAVQNVKVSFAITNASGSVKLADYAKTVSVWFGSTKVGSADVADFNKDSTGNYSKTITIADSVIRAGATENFYVSMDAQSVHDSADINSEIMTIGIDSIRFIDGTGFMMTDATIGDLPISGVPVAIVTFSTSANTEMKLSAENTPAASVVKVSTTASTNGVTMLSGKMVLDGTSDVWLDELPFTLVTVGGANLDAVASSVKLKIGDKTYTESLGANCTPTCATNTTAVVTFDNLDMNVSAGSNVNFSVTADIRDIETGTFDEGNTLTVSLLTTDRAAIIAENSKGDQLADSTEMTGSIVGQSQAFYTKGINVTLVGTPTAVATSGGAVPESDSGLFTIAFDVTAFGSDIWVDRSAPLVAGGSGESDLEVTGAGTVTSSITTSSGEQTPIGTNGFLVVDGTTETFVITTNVIATTSGFFDVAIGSIAYALTDADATTYYSYNLGTFKTPQLNLIDR